MNLNLKSIPLLKDILPFLKQFRIDPAKLVKPLEQKTFTGLLNANVAAVAARLTADNHTPQNSTGDPETERQFVRSVMYLSLKAAFVAALEMIPDLPPVALRIANVLADFVRDKKAKKVVSAALSQINAETSVEEAVRLTNQALVESIF